MTMSNERHSATIYDFSARLRAAGRGIRPVAKPEIPVAQVPVADFGGGWYHDTAIQDSERSRKQ